MNKCDYCLYKYSWDCDDGLPYPDGGCDSFEFDPSGFSIERMEE